MMSVEVRGGPFDNQMVPVDRGHELFWVVPHTAPPGYRMLPNQAALTYQDIESAIGVYSLHTSIVDRHRRDWAIYRELPHGDRD